MGFTPRNRMPGWLAVVLLACGVIFALIGLIPIVGWISDFCSWIFFGFIFSIRGASFTKNKNMAVTLVISLLAGLIPEVGDALSDIIGLAVQIYLVRREDKLYNKEQLQKMQTKKQSTMHISRDDDNDSLPAGYKRAA